MEDVDKSKYKMVLLNLKNGIKLIGPAIIHRPVGASTDIEDWIYTDFVVMHYPLRMVVDLSTERCVLGIFKYLVMTDSEYAMITTNNIESISYVNELNIKLYDTSVQYFKTRIESKFDLEVEKYIQTIETTLENYAKTSDNKTDLIDELETEKSTVDYIFGPKANTTIH